ncbi:MAG: hypothetical protein ACRYFX_04875 [Janthinobacterium lividum]
MPVDYSQYPDEWLTEIRPRILERDGHCCKFCGIADRVEGWRVPGGSFYTPEQFASDYIPPKDEAALIKVLIKKPKPYQIVLTVAHLDHKLIDHCDDNLAALCQRCHLNHDRQATAAKRKQNRRYSRKKKQLHFDFLSDICPPLTSSRRRKKTNAGGKRQPLKRSRRKVKNVPS